MRVEPRGRGRVIAVFALLAGLAAWQGASDWPWLIPAAVLGALALWCGFADEVWHLEANRLVHRVGMERWAWSRTYQDAVLDIEHRTTANFNVPYSRLYAVIGSRRCFLFDRRHADEIDELAAFISLHTGWQQSAS
jgi:hypothetical protein